jgi:protein tyrosine kinase modulator
MESQLEFSELIAFVRRRKKFLIFSFIIIFPGIVAFALILPPIYKSETTILRESQQVSQEYVRSTETSHAEARLDAATQQVMSRSNLIKIINIYDLYSEIRAKKTMEEIVSEMRDALNLEILYAKVQNERTGRSSAINTAFKLSYEGKDPQKVQKVTNTLASLYIELEMETRAKRAGATTTFFENELENLKNQIRVYEDRVSRFKEKNIGELPENYNNNARTLDRLEREYDRIESRIRTTEERKLFLEGQIATVDPLMPITTNQGKMVINPGERLKRLRLRLMSLETSLSDKHPDVKRLKNEIRELEEQVGRSDEAALKVKRIKELENEYAALSGNRSDKHPDMIRLKKEITELSDEIDEIITEKIKFEVSEEKPDNPTYINLKTQIFVAESQIKNLLKDRTQINQEIKMYRNRIERTPLVEKDYIELTRDYKAAKRKYEDISGKLMEARVSKGVAESQFGERFVIVDRAALPEKAFKPNRLSIILLGFIFSIGVGIGLAVIKESMDHSIKTIDELNSVTGNKGLSFILYVETDREKRTRRIKRLTWTIGFAGAITMMLFIVNNHILPIEKIWSFVIQRIGEL